MEDETRRRLTDTFDAVLEVLDGARPEEDGIRAIPPAAERRQVITARCRREQKTQTKDLKRPQKRWTPRPKSSAESYA